MKKVRGFVALPLILIVLTVVSIIGISLIKNNGVLVPSQAASVVVSKTVEINPSVDSYVSKLSPTTNFGTKSTLQTNATSISYLKYNLGSLVGKTITGVKISFAVSDQSSDTQTLSYTFDNNWDEKSLTWNKRPTSLTKIVNFNANQKGLNTVDLSSFIKGAKVTFNNATFTVSSAGRDTLIFSSREGSGPAKLIVSYNETVTSTASPKPTSSATATAKPTIPSSGTPHPTNMPDMPSGGSDSGGNAASFGIWDPADPKYATVGTPKYQTCSKAFHDTFYVIGPNGKKYPTWHPAVAIDPATGIKCSFGHEHGRDPSKSALWQMVKEQFYFDANKNGRMDAEEERVSGIPFGYANEQLDVYSTARGNMLMRHEDHVGHKVEFMNGEADTAGGSFGTSTTGGVVIPIVRQTNGFKWTDSGAKCYYFQKVHQGAHSPDAFTNNLHEVIFFADCKGPNPSYDQKVAVTTMAEFGASGEFTNLCTPGGDRTSTVVIGKDSMNQNYPGDRGSGTRSIIQRSCLENYFFVPTGQFSMNLYEEWDAQLFIKTAAGKTIAGGMNMTFDIEDSIRHYDPSKPNKIGYNMDLCYETLSNGRTPRGTCHVTDNGRIKGITWNDPRSMFRAIHRGAYTQGPRTDNVGGATVWYSDPFGGNAQTTPFAGSIKQYVSATNVNYLNLGPIDPRQNDRVHDDGEGTVHAPN